MQGFTNKVDEGLDETSAELEPPPQARTAEPYPYDFTRHLRGLWRVKPNSATHNRREADLQTSALAAIIRAASDMHNLSPLELSKQVGWKAGEQLRESSAEIQVALINRERSDVALPGEKGRKLAERTLEWHPTALTQTLMWKGGHQYYDFQLWVETLLTGIRRAVDGGANIICLGEFDYPPQFPDKENEKDREPADIFDEKILEIIDAAPQPIFLFGGSSHACEALKSAEYQGIKVIEFSAENVGRVFYNKALVKGVLKSRRDNPLRIAKTTPAVKIGERLSRREGIDISTFNTLFGHIVVLICADAYDPSIILHVLAKSAKDDPHRADIILVPAYNMSPKFAEMCQLLSLLSDSIVILLDVCKETTGEPKTCMEVWNCGRKANKKGENWNGLHSIDPVKVEGLGRLGTFKLDLDAAKDFKDKFGLENSMRLFAAARTLVNKPID